MTRSIEQMWARPGFVARFPVYMLYDRIIIWEYLECAELDWQRQPQTLREWAALERLGLGV